MNDVNEIEMNQIATSYKESLIGLATRGLFPTDLFVISYKEYITRVEGTFEKMDAINKYIINQEFFIDGSDDWWRTSFSEKDFLIRKKKAIKEFLEEFYSERYS